VKDDVFTVTNFWLQWHITHLCDLHCRHCYDRTRRSQMTEAQALRTLDELERFCDEHWVVGNICFTGGNPFLYSGFFELYQEAVRRRFSVEILGNPVGYEQMEKLCRIQPPDQFQVSLEGRRTHNDYIRGAGTYDSVLSFLEVLKEMKVYSGVMLTLTADNLIEVLPLAHLLEKRTNTFNFCRLSQVGEGAALAQPTPQRFRGFLKRYISYAAKSRIAAYKENLINLVRYESGQELIHGCSGFGCSVAFDGAVLLPDGEVHGCRKFQSWMGNLWEQSLEEIYFSKASETFRRGMRACDGCFIRPACGGCVAASPRPESGISDAVDPFCWRLWPGATAIHIGVTRKMS
jgi:selenobiotic family peptide radical SAM maturase